MAALTRPVLRGTCTSRCNGGNAKGLLGRSSASCARGIRTSLSVRTIPAMHVRTILAPESYLCLRRCARKTYSTYYKVHFRAFSIARLVYPGSSVAVPATAPALLSVAAPGATLPPPSLESYLPASLQVARRDSISSIHGVVRALATTAGRKCRLAYIPWRLNAG
jgi:hypothetical protein